jgi:hypothetical protein
MLCYCYFMISYVETFVCFEVFFMEIYIMQVLIN